MRDVALAIVVSVLVSAGTTYWMLERSQAESSNVSDAAGRANASPARFDRTDPTIIGVQVFRSFGKCLSNTDLKRESYGAGPVHWAIRHSGQNVSQCFRDGQTVLIRPKPGNVSPLDPPQPYDARLIKAYHQNTATRYHYEVWLANSDGSPLYLMEDPELEIVEVRLNQ